MYAPSSRPAMASYDINKARRSIGEAACCISSRICLLIWAYLRIILSVLWTCTLVFATIRDYMDYLSENKHGRNDPVLLFCELIYCSVQFVEVGMLVAFIIAGHKKNVKLYRIYYFYCIVTLILYIAAVLLCCFVDYSTSHYFGEVYLTYHVTDFPIIPYDYDAYIFAICAVLDTCLELLLLYLVKKQITKYSDYEDGDLKAGQDV